MEEEDFLNQLYHTFKAESDEHCASMRRQLLEYRQQEERAQQITIIESVFREAHNLKGSASTLGLECVEGLAHAVEDRLSAMKREELHPTEDQYDKLDEWLENFGAWVAGHPERSDLMGADPAPVHSDLDAIFLILEEQEANPAKEVPEKPVPEEPKENPSAQPAQPDPEASKREAARSRRREERLSGGAVVRVATSKLDRLMQSLGEVYISDQQQTEKHRQLDQRVSDYAGSVIDAERNEGFSPHPAFHDFNKRYHHQKVNMARDQLYRDSLMYDLQESIKSLRLEPVKALFNSFQPMAFKLARQSGKTFQLVLSGTHTEVDRQIIERLKDPLMHLIRNSVDHGLENAEERRRMGKPEEGTLRLSASNEGGYIIIEVSDDGKGMDPNALKQKALEMGILSREQADRMSEKEAYTLIMRSGFSTREQANTTSGRGVGMDVLKSNIEEINGNIMILSEIGKGSTFRIRLPLTLAILNTLQIRCANNHFLFPLNALDRTIRMSGAEILECKGQMKYENLYIALIDLVDLLELPDAAEIDPERTYPVLIFSIGEKRRALIFEEITGIMRVLVKPLSFPIRRSRFFSGGTLTGDGSVCLILNPSDLLQAQISATQKRKAPSQNQRKKKRLLVVDDSMTTVTLERALLEEAGFHVDVAFNGKQALTQLESEAYDLVVTDIGMPELDGFGLTQAIKKEPKWQPLPVVIVTSLATREDQSKGMRAGADAYLVKKAFDQEALIKTIHRLIGA